MRIALVTPGYPPTLGGVERHVAELSETLARLGHEVHVFSQDLKGVGTERETINGVTVRRFAATGPATYATSLGLIRSLRADTAWDIAHVHNYHRLVTTLVLLSADMPMVVSTHYHGTGHTAIARRLHLLYHPIGALALKRADRIIAMTDAEKSLLTRDFHGLAEKIHVIPTGIPRPASTDVRRSDQDRRTVLVMGRLAQYKYVDRVIQAMSEVPPDVRLVICGDGPDRTVLERLVADLHLGERVSFRGRVSMLSSRTTSRGQVYWSASHRRRPSVALSPKPWCGVRPSCAATSSRIVSSGRWPRRVP